MKFCCEFIQASPLVYVQAVEISKVALKQADEIREKCPISEGALSKRIVSSEKMNRLVKSSNSL